MLYPLPNSTTIGMGSTLSYINTILGGNGDFGNIFSMAILIVMFIIIIIYTSHNFSPEVSLATAGYICFVISIMFFYAGILSTGFPIMFAVLSGIGTAYLWLRRR